MLSVRKISIAIAFAAVLELPLLGKVTIDFDPNVDFPSTRHSPTSAAWKTW